MEDLLKKSINLGLGIFMYSREKVEEFVEGLVADGEIAKRDAHQFANDLIKRGEEQRKELKKMIKEEVIEALSTVGVATKDEIGQIVREQFIQVLKEQGIITD